MLLVTFILDSGRIMNVMDSENTLSKMEINMKGSIKMANSTALENFRGQMELITKVPTNLVKKMDVESTNGPMGQNTKAFL